MLKSDNPPPLTLAVQSGRRSFSSARACWGRLPRKGKIFACVVLLPTVAVFLYYLLWASPMYVSQTRFAIRSADSSGGGLDIASALLRSSSSTGADAHIVVEYIQSLDIIHDIDKELGVDLHFSDKGHDVFSRLTNNPTQDEQLRYWKWAVIPALDQDTGSEAQILPTREAPVETSRKADGPRHPAFADDLSAVGEFRAADDPHERRLSSPIEAENPHVLTGTKGYVHIIEHNLFPSGEGIGLGNVMQRNHCSALLRA